MGEAIHIPLEILTGEVRAASTQRSEDTPAARDLHSSERSAAAQCGTFLLETFGCQMNEHDSEKVAGVLLARGYRQVGTVEAASLILYNTCSIREKAAQKLFSRLGEYRAKQSEG